MQQQKNDDLITGASGFDQELVTEIDEEVKMLRKDLTDLENQM